MGTVLSHIVARAAAAIAPHALSTASAEQGLLDKPQALFALVLSPTRELAIQIAEQFEYLGAGIGVRTARLVGGIDMMAQVSCCAHLSSSWLPACFVHAVPPACVCVSRSQTQAPAPPELHVQQGEASHVSCISPRRCVACSAPCTLRLCRQSRWASARTCWSARRAAWWTTCPIPRWGL